jgi:hypothetical protein
MLLTKDDENHFYLNSLKESYFNKYDGEIVDKILNSKCDFNFLWCCKIEKK